VIDRERFQYYYDDFRTRPERVRAAAYVGAAIAAVVLVLVAVVLSRGAARPVKRTRVKVEPATAPTTPTMRDAFAYAKDLETRVRPLERFARVYFVPSADTPNQAYGKVMVMGEVASETDFTELQRLLVQGGVPLTLDMQVTYPEPQ